MRVRRRHHPLSKTSTVATIPEEDSFDPSRTAPAHVNLGGGGLRKKAAGVRQWLLLDSTGQAQVVEVDKHTVMRRTGLPARDLRILDPILSYPSTVLGRERAIVINLEHIKAIITAHEVLLLNSKDPNVAPFVEELQRRILRQHHANASQEGTARSDDTDWANLYDLEPQSKEVSPAIVSTTIRERGDGVKADGIHFDSRDGLKLLEFEFVALEACLEAACSSLDKEARTLEKEAHPALDKLTRKISTLNLERVRQIKSRLVAISGRVQKVRDELEHLLDDDGDMAEMYLTDKLEQRLDNASMPSFDEQDAMDEQLLQPETDYRVPVDGPMEGNENIHEGDIQWMNSQQEHFFGPNALGKDSRGTRTSMARSGINKRLDVQELEMLLEAYFVQIDGTLNKLSTLREYVDDTEDYINIMLDDKQNHLLQMGVMLSTANLVVSAFVVVAGVFGMNISIELFNGDTPAQKEIGMRRFLWTVGGGTTGSIFLYVIAIAWCKNQRLLE
ncbi:magnesium transporter MRS2-3-like [Cynara cardunculus var. scolymus]|uniref:magnesium transporter MRS2-3-like n=1 Tax=Cynara cardunculus var. scolymus TaxID=59895 RepID=UPI000D623072|nr:magnesium transporter MRS2-3-like [Cynara cardunculus var. scolymus]